MKAILIGVEYDHMYYDLNISMNELKDLAYACHIEVKDTVIQKLTKISPQYYIGKGKVLEIKAMLDKDDMIILMKNYLPFKLRI